MTNEEVLLKAVRDLARTPGVNCFVIAAESNLFFPAKEIPETIPPVININSVFIYGIFDLECYPCRDPIEVEKDFNRLRAMRDVPPLPEGVKLEMQSLGQWPTKGTLKRYDASFRLDSFLPWQE